MYVHILKFIAGSMTVCNLTALIELIADQYS